MSRPPRPRRETRAQREKRLAYHREYNRKYYKYGRFTIAVRLDTDLVSGLARLQVRDGIPRSEALRRALAQFLIAQGIEYIPAGQRRGHPKWVRAFTKEDPWLEQAKLQLRTVKRFLDKPQER
jgi:hypothetical protein